MKKTEKALPGWKTSLMQLRVGSKVSDNGNSVRGRCRAPALPSSNRLRASFQTRLLLAAFSAGATAAIIHRSGQSFIFNNVNFIFAPAERCLLKCADIGIERIEGER